MQPACLSGEGVHVAAPVQGCLAGLGLGAACSQVPGMQGSRHTRHTPVTFHGLVGPFCHTARGCQGLALLVVDL